jgi:ubiquinone/menaquinone biosynthesis C-methylase UbiE
MRKIDFKKDQEFYNIKCKAPAKYKNDQLDLYRFRLLLKLYQGKDREVFKNKTILNVACGYGREAYLILNQKPKILALCDYSLSQVKQAKKYLEKFDGKYLLCADGERLPFKDKSFDISFITEALHHFIHPDKGLEELIRVTKETIFIDEPSGGFIRRALNRLFILFGIKEEYERGYLDAFRVHKSILKEFCLKYKFDLIFFPYFIYYFEWYKKGKNEFIKLVYKNFLVILNIFFHFFGNRAIIILIRKG